MKTILALCLLLATPAPASDLYTEIHGDGHHTLSQKQDAERRLERMKAEVDREGLYGVAERTDRTLRGIMFIAVKNLKRRGFTQEANELSREWKRHENTLQILVMKPNRDIGDFKPLSEFLAKAYDKLEEKLGLEICRALRLSDIKTLNYAIPVVFAPCKHNELQFDLHLCHDSKYRGLLPVVAYWTTSITCSVATFGAGYFFVCSPIAMLVELGMDRVACPWLSPRLYEAFCGSVD